MTSEWFSPLAIATFVLASVAVWSILQTRSIQKSEKRQRQLNEIRDWAIEISRLGLDRGYPVVRNQLEVQSTWNLLCDHTDDLVRLFSSMEEQNKYISAIAPKIDKGLGTVVDRLISKYDEHLEFLRNTASYMRDRRQAWDLAVVSRAEVNLHVEMVTQEIARLKTE